jgi:hypothetical protein
MEHVIWRIAVMKKRQTTQRDKETKGQREPQGGVFPSFIPLTLCVEKAFFANYHSST